MSSTSTNPIPLPTADELHDAFAGELEVRKRFAADIVHTLSLQSLKASIYEDREATDATPSSLLLAGQKPGKGEATRASWTLQLSGSIENPPSAWNATLRVNVEGSVTDDVTFALDRLSADCAAIAETKRVDLPQVSTKAGAFEIVMGMVVGGSAMKQVVNLIGKYAPEDSPVLIIGETGTGKERIAQALHAASGRKGKKVTLNCGCIPKDLIASELFGYERGAFSGANRAKSGAFQEADGGTLFLDEIGDMPMDQQIALLRVLQEGTIRKVGSNVEKVVDVRVVAATNRNLEELVAEGTFRLDLLHRLNVLTIPVPPLRERPDEIPSLVQHYLDTTNSERGLNLVMTSAALDLMRRHSWPGNVRELVGCLDRARIHSDGHLIDDVVLRVPSVFTPDTVGVESLSGSSFDEQVQAFARGLITTAIKTAADAAAAAVLLQMPEPLFRKRVAELGLQRLLPDAAIQSKPTSNLRSVAGRRPTTSPTTSAAAVA